MLETSRLLASVPGLVHGFADREGGVSKGRYATLNLGAKWGDAAAAVAENLARVGAAAGFDPTQLVQVRQVHEANVLHVSALDADASADGLWSTAVDGVVVGVLTADCVPVLLADRAGTVACAVHSGWRGTVAGIAGAAVATLAQRCAPGDLLAAIGPCIELEAFEVGEEVAQRFPAAFVERGRFSKPHVDLVGMLTAQLVAAGVPEASVERVGGCTFANPDRYFSYRRDGAGIGQMLAFAGFPAAAAPLATR